MVGVGGSSPLRRTIHNQPRADFLSPNVVSIKSLHPPAQSPILSPAVSSFLFLSFLRDLAMLKFFAYIFLGLIIAALIATFLLFMGA